MDAPGSDGPGRRGWPDVPGHELLRVIGRGGFATVYEARQVSVERLVAVKVISVGMLSDATERRFRSELRTVGSLSWHPHVVGVYDGGLTEGGLPFLSMELVTDGSWGDRVRRDGPLPAGLVARLGGQVADALHEAHEAGIVHRDVKPDNILVGRRQDALLTDFGIATLADASTNTATGTFVGTIAYSAPEVLRGERASARSDVYALGATLRTLATGQPPYETSAEMTPVAELLRVVEQAPPPLPATVPAGLAAVIDRAMARDPADRPASAAEVQTALAALGPGGDAPGGSPEATVVAPPEGLTVRDEAPLPPTLVKPAPTRTPPATPAPPVAPTPPPPSWTPPPPAGPTPPPPVAPTPPPPSWTPPPMGTPPPPPSWAPAPAAVPVSGLAIAGLVTSLLCCTPVGLGLAVAGHVQVRRGTRRGRGLVWGAYVTVALVTVAWVAVFGVATIQLRADSERFVGEWRSTSELEPITLHLEAPNVGTSLEGSFDAVRDGVGCRGTIDEGGRSGDLVDLDLDGSCDDGTDYARSLEVFVGEDGDTLLSSNGPSFRRQG
ncbi:MAG TPA: serine/threonine-protein kinase [Iamia sp.]